MIFEQVRSGGCLSYVVGCDATRAALIVDPELDQIDRYLGLLAEKACVCTTCSTPTRTPIASAQRASSRGASGYRW